MIAFNWGGEGVNSVCHVQITFHAQTSTIKVTNWPSIYDHMQRSECYHVNWERTNFWGKHTHTQCTICLCKLIGKYLDLMNLISTLILDIVGSLDLYSMANFKYGNHT